MYWFIFVSFKGITGLTFGVPTTATGIGFSLGSNTATTPSLSTPPSNLPNFALTSSMTPTPGVSGLSFDPAKASVTTAIATGFSPATTTAGGFSFGVPAAKPLTGMDF